MTTMYESGSPYIMTGADIVRMGEPAEMLVGGKNYNTALISRVEGIRTPQFRAIPATAFQLVLDQSRVNAALIYQIVDAAMADVDWTSPPLLPTTPSSPPSCAVPLRTSARLWLARAPAPACVTLSIRS